MLFFEDFLVVSFLLLGIDVEPIFGTIQPSLLGLYNTPTKSQQRGKTPVCQRLPGYDIEQSDSEALVMFELSGMWSTLSLPLLPGPLWPGVVAPDRVLAMGQIELFDI